MEKKIRSIFDYQQFSASQRLQGMIEEVRNRYQLLADDDLMFVNAAGTPHQFVSGKEGDDCGND